MRKLVSQLFKEVASDTAKKSLILPAVSEEPLKLLFLNGYGFYLRPLVKLEFVFGLKSGDARGLRAFIDRHLRSFVARFPSIEFQVRPRNGAMAHIRGTYVTGPPKLFAAHNKKPIEIQRGLMTLVERSGERAARFRTGVQSVMPAVRPIWSPFHADRSNRLTRFVARTRSQLAERRTRLLHAQAQQQARLSEGKVKFFK